MMFINLMMKRYEKSVSTFGKYLVVGSPLEENSFGEAKSGKAFLYKRDGEQYRFLKEFYSPTHKCCCC